MKNIKAERELALDFLRVTEAAAIGSAKTMGAGSVGHAIPYGSHPHAFHPCFEQACLSGSAFEAFTPRGMQNLLSSRIVAPLSLIFQIIAKLLSIAIDPRF